MKASPPGSASDNSILSHIETELHEGVTSIGSTPDYRSFDLSLWNDVRLKLGKGSKAFRDADGNLLPQKNVLFLELVRPSLANPAINEDFIIGVPRWSIEDITTPKQNPPLPKTKAPAPPRLVADQEATPVVAQPNTDQPKIDLGNQADLKASVKFSSHHVALPALVTELQKQSGIHLNVAPGPLTKSFVTAISEGMPLSEAMTALERLYSAHWTQQNGDYVLQSDSLNQVDAQLAREGVLAYYVAQEGIWGNKLDDMGSDVADELTGLVDHDQLSSPDGVAFSSLPKEIQQKVFDFFVGAKCSPLIVAEQRLKDLEAQAIQVRFAPMSPITPSFYGAFYTPASEVSGPLNSGAAGLCAYTADGKFVCQLFSDFYVSPPTDADKRHFLAMQTAAPK